MNFQCALIIFFLTVCPVFGQEQMEIDGAIIVGQANSPNPAGGTIRWNPTTQDFEGYDGSQWLSLTNGQSAYICPPPMTVEEQYSTAPLETGAFSSYAVAIEGKFAFIGSPADFNNKG